LVARGDVAWLELEQEGRRPVVVLTRDEALERLRNVMVALVTRTIRGIDTEVQLGPADGMPIECAVQPRQPPDGSESAPDRAHHQARPRTHERDLPSTRASYRLLINRRSVAEGMAPAQWAAMTKAIVAHCCAPATTSVDQVPTTDSRSTTERRARGSRGQTVRRLRRQASGIRCAIYPCNRVCIVSGTWTRTGAMTEWWEHGAERVDKLMAAVGWVLVFANWITDRQIKDRLADVEVPHGAQLTILIFTLIGRRIRPA
jgi:hypothetical protein